MAFSRVEQATLRANTLNVLSKTFGGLTAIMSLSLLAPYAFAVLNNERDQWTYLSIAGIGLIVGGLLFIRDIGDAKLRARQVFMLTTLCWLYASLFAALPLMLAGAKLSWTDAWFEAMSAITTTGSTVVSGLDQLPQSYLLWRGILQWLGGVGIIVMAMAILPFLQVGGMRLFQAESSDISGKFMPRSSHMVWAIARIYLLLSALIVLCYYVFGMSGFDAFVHAMTTVATGGFSNYDASFGAFNDTPALVWLGTLFMAASALPFVLYIRLLKGETRPLREDPQVRAFLLFLLVVIAALSLIDYFEEDGRSGFDAVTHTAFNVVSVVTTTGYASEDYTRWGSWAMMAFFYLTFVGGCTGSTAGGMKIFRFQLSQLLLRKQFLKLIHPSLISAQRYQDRQVDDSLLGSIVAFCFMYFILVAAVAFVLTLFGLDFMTAISGSATAVSNVGPGLGEIIGPAGNFLSLPDGAKITLIFAMLCGRLEIITVLILLHKRYWQY
ncbi:TrkH family potassium uptake protein [Idiomarina xiamenensis]|uniref:Trk system potassium uptake protein n=1 Tax=Idiomarina xiamenensis 10-D-4 TaxID=740709 RepID=K2KYK5_9GAMM|nr:TrkH family potassium uptake protein [Idiomarina xiamenensis]EKE82775.1 K+ transport system membrane component [Idiomarina xiamenensis 10-D-4]